MKRTTYIMQ